jgi:hypothetical protein
MTRQNASLHLLLDGITNWNDDLQKKVEDWLIANCTRHQLIAIADRSRHHEIAPSHLAEPIKAVLTSDLVERLTPSELLAAWQQVIDDEAERDAAFKRLLDSTRRS